MFRDSKTSYGGVEGNTGFRAQKWPFFGRSPSLFALFEAKTLCQSGVGAKSEGRVQAKMTPKMSRPPDWHKVFTKMTPKMTKSQTGTKSVGILGQKWPQKWPQRWPKNDLKLYTERRWPFLGSFFGHFWGLALVWRSCGPQRRGHFWGQFQKWPLIFGVQKWPFLDHFWGRFWGHFWPSPKMAPKMTPLGPVPFPAPALRPGPEKQRFEKPLFFLCFFLFFFFEVKFNFKIVNLTIKVKF